MNELVVSKSRRNSAQEMAGRLSEEEGKSWLVCVWGGEEKEREGLCSVMKDANPKLCCCREGKETTSRMCPFLQDKALPF